MNGAYEKPPVLRIAEMDRQQLFPTGLEYNTPARGMWNIVHTGMLLPGSHQIYACAQGCLRGVILTAAEMNALDRMSWVALTEQDMFDGRIEQNVIDGVTEIITHLPQHPRVVLLFFSCMHLFAGCDIAMMISALSDRFPDIHFTDCYMIPTMRQTMPPAVLTASALYDALQPLPTDPKAINLIGNDRPTDAQCEMLRLLQENGYVIRDIAACGTYEEYLQMAGAALNITYLPVAKRAGEDLQKRLGIPWLHMALSYEYDEILMHYRALCDTLGLEMPDFSREIAAAEQALAEALSCIGDMDIAIDYTAVPRPFELAKVLLEHGFHVRHVIADAAGEDAAAFDWLQANAPDLLVYQAVNVNMLHMHAQSHAPTLCIGQKAAYYFASDHFVNIVSGGGLYGIAGLRAMVEQMVDACVRRKDRTAVLRHKGIGCESCLL